MTDTLTVQAPAKINLTLEVLGERPDGFHEIRSVMQSVDLCDSLVFGAADTTTINCDMPGWNAGKSLVSRAVKLFGEKTGCSRGVSINISKKIPLMSGLGGDSSDAAAVLRGLNELRDLDLSLDDMAEMAAELGSDVVFFINDGTALATGRGEVITPLPSLTETWLVLVIPEIPQTAGKTARMYQSLEASHYTDGKITEKLVAAITRGDKPDASFLFNTFENIAYGDFVIRRVYVEHLEKLGASRVHLAGSGPALFVVFEKGDTAADFYVSCKDQGMKVYNITTESIK
ncbi:MAG: 4-(cytidine 5'-diphospho)-2-C-methyl-D-erythritol kinase [Dehalococcoidia bacterium]